MNQTKPMTVADLIAALQKLPQDVYVCGIADDESVGIADSVNDVRMADKWHDSLPERERFVTINFGAIVPHVRGEGEFAEQVPPPPPKPVWWRCSYCEYQEGGTHPMSCPRCSWRPMMKEMTVERKEMSK